MSEEKQISLPTNEGQQPTEYASVKSEMHASDTGPQKQSAESENICY